MIVPDSLPITQLNPRQAVLLQLAPGLANLPVFFVVAYFFGQLGLPSFLALAVTLLIAEIPVSWFIMAKLTRRETGGRFDFAVAFPWRASLPWWQYLLIGVPVVLFGMVMIGGVAPMLGSAIRSGLDLNIPTWFLLEPDPEIFAAMSHSTLILTWLAMLTVFAGVGGITQELYSRGFLLPRTAHWGVAAPLFNAVLFGVFHLNAPWSWPGFILLALPWAYLVWWKQSCKIGLFGHVGMLFMQSMLMAALVFGLAPMDRMVN